jgi:hypothetical protein
MALEFPPALPAWSGAHRNFKVLRGADIRVMPRKPIRARQAEFQAKVPA